MSQIVVPLDGSAAAEAALPYAAFLAAATASSLRLLQVIAPAGQEAAGDGPDRARPRWGVEEDVVAWHYLRRIARWPTLRNLDIAVEVVSEPRITPAIISCAGRCQEVLAIVLARHGAGLGGEQKKGSVVRSLLESTPCPVLLPAVASAMPRAAPFATLLVPLDGSSCCEQALSVARRLAAASGATLALLGLPLSTGEVPADYLDTRAGELRAEGLRVRVETVSAESLADIPRVGQVVDAALVVVGAQGGSPLAQPSGGSIEALIEAVEVPILIVPCANQPADAVRQDIPLGPTSAPA